MNEPVPYWYIDFEGYYYEISLHYSRWICWKWYGAMV